MIKTTDLELCSEKSAPSKSYVSIDADLTWIHPLNHPPTISSLEVRHRLDFI